MVLRSFFGVLTSLGLPRPPSMCNETNVRDSSDAKEEEQEEDHNGGGRQKAPGAEATNDARIASSTDRAALGHPRPRQRHRSPAELRSAGLVAP